ncbi:3-methyladenine DNA glycosylase [Streptomyces sp. NPDC049910]|uniref:3-methyladenine DNA glycosylase n=1 Tax=Streptomyces sp. NPDC049910 TaxID=3155278 RepID=UPI00342AF2F5
MIGSPDRTPPSRAFLERPPRPMPRVEPGLPGHSALRRTEDGPAEPRLTEAAAHAGETAAGPHAVRGRTARSEAVFGPPGHVRARFPHGMSRRAA